MQTRLRAAWRSSLRLSLNDIMRIVAAQETVSARVNQAFHLNCKALVSFLAKPDLHSTADEIRVGGGGGGNSGDGGDGSVAAAAAAIGAGTIPPLRGPPKRAQRSLQKSQQLRAHRAILHQCAAQRRLDVLRMLDVCAANSGACRYVNPD